jgi:long-chain fatty acid transport protein
MKTKVVMAALATAGVFGWAATSRATNGMDLEGYGPISQGQGGASLAQEKWHRRGDQQPGHPVADARRGPAALTWPSVCSVRTFEASCPASPTAHSSGDSDFMPAFGYVTRDGDFTYGVGVFGQGGMGTRYSENSFLALNSGDPVMSEVSVGRVILPVSYAVLENLSVAGTLDFSCGPAWTCAWP